MVIFLFIIRFFVESIGEISRKSNKLLQSDTKMRADFRVGFKVIGAHFCAAEQGVSFNKVRFTLCR